MYRRRLSAALPVTQGVQAIRSALDAGASATKASGQALSVTATEGIAEKCIPVLKQMRAISTTHRMVNRFDFANDMQLPDFERPHSHVRKHRQTIFSTMAWALRCT